MTRAIGLALVALLAGPAAAARDVSLWTDLGEIRIEVLGRDAPEHAANFVARASAGEYTGTRFHRVLPGYFIQGGSPASVDGDPRPDWSANPGDALAAEPGGPALARGVVAMARDVRGDGASDRAQFFIVLGPAPLLQELGFTTFGRVVAGLDVADRIASAARDPANYDRPLQPVVVRRVRVQSAPPSRGDGAEQEDEATAPGQATPWVPPVEPRDADGPAGAITVPPIAAERSDLARRRVVVSVRRANVRSGPGIDNEIVARLGEGTSLISDTRRGRWYRVGLPGARFGWLRDDTIEVGAGPPDDVLSP